MQLPLAHPVAGIIANAATLADAFHRHGRPVVSAVSDGTPPGRTDYGGPRPTPAGWNDRLRELPQAEGDLHVTRPGWSVFANTDLHAHLQALGVTQVVLAGLATGYGVESTARAAYDLGYHVVLVTDAMCDPTADGHDHSVTRIFPALGETTSTAMCCPPSSTRRYPG